jgi:hypothetical protein
MRARDVSAILDRLQAGDLHALTDISTPDGTDADQCRGKGRSLGFQSHKLTFGQGILRCRNDLGGTLSEFS